LSDFGFDFPAILVFAAIGRRSPRLAGLTTGFFSGDKQEYGPENLDTNFHWRRAELRVVRLLPMEMSAFTGSFLKDRQMLTRWRCSQFQRTQIKAKD
jgi:hypothetical protein